MSKHALAASVAAVVLTFAPVVYAQTAPARPAAAATDMRPGEIRASKFIGSSVYDTRNQKVGSIKDVIFDRSGRIDKAVVDVGSFLGIGGKLVAIGLGDLKTENDRLVLDRTKDQLKAEQEFRFGDTERTGSSTPPARRARPHGTRY